MGCIYSNFKGKCSLYDGNIEITGCGSDGVCYSEDDPDPSYSCDSYESDYYCNNCGKDLNIEECECDE